MLQTEEGFGLGRRFICHKMVSLSMRKSTTQKDLAGHTKQLHDIEVDDIEIDNGLLL